MFGKKNYSKPDIEKLPLDDDSLDLVTGGVGDRSKKKSESTPDTTVYADPIASLTDSAVADVKKTPTSTDVSAGRGRGGGCDGVAYHRNARTFSSGRNSGC